MTKDLKTFWLRNFAIALAVHLAISPLWPVAASYAQEASEPAPVVETTPTPEPTPTENTNATDGTDGNDGSPAPDTAPQDGENGDSQTSTEPAGTGENGDSSNATEDPPAVTDPAPAEVVTGNASSDTTATNSANTTSSDIMPVGTTYPFGKPPTWYILLCQKSWQPHCDKYIVKPPPVVVQTTQDLVMENEGESVAETGENEAQSQDSGASVKTGNADAFGYLISLFNVAVTNSQGSLLFLKNPLSTELDFTDRIMNMFNNLASDVGGCSLSGCSLADAVLNIITDQSAEVTNDLVVRAGTGTNTSTSDSGVASVDTGNASAFGGIVNFGNLQIVDSRYMIILMANQGNLDGNIVLPDANFFRTLSTGSKFGPRSSLNADNTADVTNNGTANALSGSNTASASSTQEQAQIQTGQANSDSVAMNFVNQIGAPVCFIVNVGGAWQGNVVRLPDGFSREKTSYGEIICGAGTNESRAGVRGVHASTTNYAKVLNNAIVEATTGNNAAAGAAAKIKTGDANAVVQILNVLNQTIIGQDWIFALFTVSGDWKGNLVFGPDPAGSGSDPLTQIAGQILVGTAEAGGGAPGGYISNPNVTIEKTASIVKASAPAKVDYKIVVKNNKGGGAIYRAKLADTLKGPDGNRVFARHWVLNTIKDGEEITVNYTVEYNTGIPYGVYNNTAKLTGFKNESIYIYPQPLDPATDSVDVSVDEKSDVVAVNDGPQCVPLLQSYMKVGKPVDMDDVKDLQGFLNAWEGEALDVTGIYDYITVAAVKRFQAKYSSEVLTPWGIEEPTGHVYYTTQRKINDLYCVNGDSFGLSEQQLGEINAFKSRYQASPGTVNPAYEEVGTNLPKSFPGKALTGKKSGTQVLLKDVNAPAPIFKATSNKKKNDTVSSSEPNWYKLFFPFVDAFEIR